MPKQYGIKRHLNLGRYGVQYDSIDISVEGCDSAAEAEKEINAWRTRIEEAFKPAMEKRLKQLNEKARLTASEEREREEVIAAQNTSPF